MSVHATAVVAPGAEIGDGADVGPYCVVGPHVKVGAGTRLLSHVVLDGWTTVGAGCTLYPFACIGTQTQDLKFKGDRTYTEIGDRTTLREYVTVNSGTVAEEVTRVGADCNLLAYCHVAHGCQVGDGVIMSNAAMLSGHIVVQEHAVIGGMTGVHQFVRIGRLCMVGGMARVTKDCPPYMLVEGSPAEVRGVNVIGMKRRHVSEEAQAVVKEAHRILYRMDLSTRQAVDHIRAELDPCPELECLLKFIAESERGILK